MRPYQLIVAGILVAGCAQETSTDRQKPAPNPESSRGGVKVEAPATTVDVDRDRGRVKVKAPGVNVDVEREKK